MMIYISAILAIFLSINNNLFASSSPEDIQAMATAASQKAEENTWEIEGRFDRIIDSGDGLLNRCFNVTPKFVDSGIKGISVLGYYDCDIKIGIHFNIPINYGSDLEGRSVYDEVLSSSSSVYSRDKNRLGEFLAVFVSGEIIPKFVADQIIMKIETESC